MDVPRIIFHYNRHSAEIEAIRFRHHTLPEAMCDMVGAQEPGEHDSDLDWDKDENCGIPSLEHEAFKLHVRQLATGQDTPRIARLADGSLDERRKIATAFELILDAHAAFRAEFLGPLGVDFALEVERAFFVSDISRSNQKGESDPGEECVPCEEAAVIEEDTGPADDGGEDAYTSCEGGEDKLLTVSSTDDVGVLPDVEPGKETNDEGGERVKGHLGRVSSGKK